MSFLAVVKAHAYHLIIAANGPLTMKLINQLIAWDLVNASLIIPELVAANGNPQSHQYLIKI